MKIKVEKGILKNINGRGKVTGYECTYYVGSTRKRKTCNTLSEARKLRAKHLLEHRGGYTDGKVAEVCDMFLQKVAEEASNFDAVNRAINRFKDHADAHGWKLMSQIGTRELIGYRDMLTHRTVEQTGEYMKASSVNRELRPLRRMFNIAHFEYKMLEHDPFTEFQRGQFFPEEDDYREVYLNDEEIRAMIQAIRPDYARRIVLFMTQTAFDRSDCIELKWEQVDFHNQVIRKKREKLKHRNIRNGNRGYATIPFGDNPVIQDVLTACKGDHPEYVFMRTPENRPNPQTFSQIVKAAQEKIGLQRDKWGTKVVRHSVISRWANLPSMKLKTVRDLAGHASVKMTERYVHVSDVEESSRAVNAMASIVAPAKDASIIDLSCERLKRASSNG